ncbi:hypothetical protein pEaSNUABM29_00047 [Erwinia phage pEa_SNUABM_29]|nr:hypothetical protein pEaSNUABM29_00047 [Erwinia phage pEa_SNUABM_29]
MLLLNLHGVDKNDMTVEFSGRLITLGTMRERIQQLRPYEGDGDDHWLVFSNSGKAQLYFRGQKSGNVFYIYELHVLGEPFFSEWKRLTRALEVLMLDISCFPHDTEHAALYQKLGFEAVTKRVEVKVVGEFDYPAPDDVKALEELTLEQTEAVCYLMRPTLKDAGTREMLGELANGFVSAFVGMHGEKPFSLLLYKEFPKSIITEQFCCQSFDPITSANEYRKHFDMILRLAAKLGKVINLGVPIEHELPSVEGVETRVVTHHYTLA